MVVLTLAAWILAAKAQLRGQLQPTLLAWLVNTAVITFLSRHSYVDVIACSRVGIGMILAGLMCGVAVRSRLVLVFSQFYSLTFPVYVAGVVLGIRSLLL